MTTKTHLTIRNKLGDLVADAVDSGSTNASGYIEIRSDPKPNSPEDAATGKLLVTIKLANPAFTSFINGTASALPTVPSSVVESGKATWFRLYDRDGNTILDGDVSDQSGSGDIILNNTSLVVGGSVILTAIQLVSS